MSASENLNPEQFGMVVHPGAVEHHEGAMSGVGRHTRINPQGAFHTGQTVVNPRVLAHYQVPANRAATSRSDTPIEIVKDAQGRHWVSEGHHRLIAARLAGQKRVRATLYDASEWLHR